MPVFVNNKEISDEAVFEEMQYHPAESATKAMAAAARALVMREILLQEAVNLGTYDENLSPEDNLDQLLEKAVPISIPSEAECRRFYEQNRKKFVINSVPQSFEEVRSIIEDYICNYSWNSSVQQYLKLLVSEAKVLGVSMNPEDF